jgi:surface polysaccharide O-acyltransferase-like enzyme
VQKTSDVLHPAFQRSFAAQSHGKRLSLSSSYKIIHRDLAMPTAVRSTTAPAQFASVQSVKAVAAWNYSSVSSVRLDVVRVIACLAVILLHLSATIVMDRDLLGTVGWHIANVIDAATRWCVPVFVMLSGALLLDPQKHTSPHEFWTRRVNRLLPALIVWSTIYLAWRAYFWKEALSLDVISHDLVVGRPYIHLYFLFLIAGLYLVTPFLARMIGNLSSAQLRQTILIISALAMVANLFDWLESSALTLFVPYLAYYLGGWYCARVWVDHPRAYGWVLAGAIGIISVLTALLVPAQGLDDRWSFYFYEDFSPTTMVMTVAVFMLTLRAPIPSQMEALAQRLAPWTLGVYVAHPIVVEILRYGYYHTVPILLLPPYYVPVTFVATCVLTFGLIALMQQVPGLRRIV